MYSRILVPVDGSAPAESGMQEAVRIAAGTGATLVVLNVVTEFPMLMDPIAMVDYTQLLEALKRTGAELVARAARSVAEAVIACETVVVEASTSQASDVIVEQAKHCRCDLIVMGTHGRRGLRRLTLGSDAELVVRHSPVPVLLVKDAAEAR